MAKRIKKPKLYESDQVHPSGVRGADAVPDTHDHADIESTQRGPAHGETHYVPGDGFLVSHGGFSQRSKGTVYEEKKKAILAGRPKGNLKPMADKGTFLTEQEVLEMAAAVRAHRRMTGAKGAKEEFFERVRASVHEGTDAVDSAKDGFHKGSDEFDVDKSRSTIHIGLAQIGPPGMALNGSKVLHRSAVFVDISGPDGRNLVRIAASPEQFAAALFSNASAPCTVESYWSIDDDSVRLTERVRRPESVRRRMEKRLKNRMAEQIDALRDVVREMVAQADSGKPARKTQLKDLAERIERASDHYAANSAFTIEQAREEVSAIMESAAIQFIGQRDLDARTLWAAAGPALEMHESEDEQ